VVKCGFGEFLKDKRIEISCLIFAMITIEIFLMIYPVGNFIRVYVFVIISLMYIIRNFNRIF